MYLYAGLLKFLLSADAVNRRNVVSVAKKLSGGSWLGLSDWGVYFSIFLSCFFWTSYMGGILRVSFSKICLREVTDVASIYQLFVR